jgi:pimeloyl-ACP methyl ester carboxylesterase
MPYQGYEIRYDEYGDGQRPIVLIHNLFLNRHMFEVVGPQLAERGNRVICLDLLGHGDSDQPNDPRHYSTRRFARQVTALLNHLELESAVVGGAFIGANVALELAVHDPVRVEGLVIQTPILDKALAINAAVTTTMLVALRAGRPLLDPLSRFANLIPRSHFLIDAGLDLMRRSPGPSAEMLNGILLGELAPPQEDRREIPQPALVIGRRRGTIGPFSDSGLLASELSRAHLVEAGSPFDWTFSTRGLMDELNRFLDQVWAESDTLAGVGLPANGNGRRPHVAVGR